MGHSVCMSLHGLQHYQPCSQAVCKPGCSGRIFARAFSGGAWHGFGYFLADGGGGENVLLYAFWEIRTFMFKQKSFFLIFPKALSLSGELSYRIPSGATASLFSAARKTEARLCGRVITHLLCNSCTHTHTQENCICCKKKMTDLCWIKMNYELHSNWFFLLILLKETACKRQTRASFMCWLPLALVFVGSYERKCKPRSLSSSVLLFLWTDIAQFTRTHVWLRPFGPN